MRSRTLARSVLLVPAAGLALILAACSGGSSTTTPPATTSAAQSSGPAASGPASATGGATGGATAPAGSLSPEPASGSAAQAAIKQNWQAFFDGKTPGSQKIGLLQNGQTFAQTINAQASSALAQAATATVHSVTINGSTASVNYDVGISGGLGLPNQTGKAIYQDGIWKVSDASFCGLLTIEGGGKAPAICASVK